MCKSRPWFKRTEKEKIQGDYGLIGVGVALGVDTCSFVNMCSLNFLSVERDTFCFFHLEPLLDLIVNSP